MNHFKLADNLNVLPMLKEVAMQWDDFNLETGRQDTIEVEFFYPNPSGRNVHLKSRLLSAANP